MKKLFILSLGLFACLPVATHADQNLAGNVTITGGAANGKLNVTGAIDSDSNTFTFGTQSSSYGAAMLYLDNAVDTLSFSINRSPASWLWVHNSNVAAMRLNSAHQLVLYQADGTTAGVTLTPASNQLSLGTATLTGSGNNLTAGAGLTVTGALTASSGITNTNGTFAGGSTGLSLNAGGTNQNVTITPSGSGYTRFNGNVGINAVPTYYQFEVQGVPKFYPVSGGNNYVLLGAAGQSSGGSGVVLGYNQTYNGTTMTNSAFIQAESQGVAYRNLLLSPLGGNVGIGTSSPAVALDVANGIIRTRGLGPSYGTLYGTALNSPQIFSNGGSSDFWFYTPASTSTDLILSNGYNMDSTLNIRYTPGAAGAGSGVLQIGQLAKQSQPTFTHGITGFFTNGIERLRINNSGNVGLGTTTPATALDLGGGSSYVNANPIYQLFTPNDKVVQVRSSAQSVLSLLSDVNADEGKIGGLYFGRTVGQSDAWINLIGLRGVQRGGPGATTWGDLTVHGNLNGELLRVRGDTGNVGIGTTNPTHKLSVNGTIRAKEIIVDNTGWADYVFDENYSLAPLSEVESHIKAKKHLPGIPSAAEVAEHGVSMGDMQSKLLSKVEELTLHLIAQEKRIQRLEQENHALRATRAGNAE